MPVVLKRILLDQDRAEARLKLIHDRSAVQQKDADISLAQLFFSEWSIRFNQLLAILGRQFFPDGIGRPLHQMEMARRSVVVGCPNRIQQRFQFIEPIELVSNPLKVRSTVLNDLSHMGHFGSRKPTNPRQPKRGVAAMVAVQKMTFFVRECNTSRI